MDSLPTLEAERLLKEWEVDSLPVRPVQIAARSGIPCQAMPSSSGGVSGILVKAGDSFGIMYATHIQSEGFQHFSIAHELGHYFLPKHPENVFVNGMHQSSAGFKSDDKYEKEADQFACGLLMPSYLFDVALDEVGEGLDAILALASRCEVSRTAAAIRYAQRHEEQTAIVISSNGLVEYCFMSHGLKYLQNITYLKKGTPVPRGTKTKLLDSTKILRGERAEGNSEITTWFGGDRGGAIYEEVLGLGAYGKALTVLSCSELPDEEELEEEKSMEDSWEVRFR